MRMVMSHAGDSALKNTPMMLPAPPRRTAPVAQCSESSHSTPRAPTLHSRCCRGGAVVEVAKGVKWPTGSGRRTPPAQLCSCSAVEAGSKPPAPARPPLNRPGPAATWRRIGTRRATLPRVCAPASCNRWRKPPSRPPIACLSLPFHVASPGPVALHALGRRGVVVNDGELASEWSPVRIPLCAVSLALRQCF
jgi:hypothetical protein